MDGLISTINLILFSWLWLTIVKVESRLEKSPVEFIQGESGSITCTRDDGLVRLYNSRELVTNCILTFNTCNIIPESLRLVYSLSKTTTSLTINIAKISRERDGGTWNCYGANNAKIDTIDTINVRVPVPYINIENKGNLVFRDNIKKEIKCITGQSFPTVTSINWTIDGTIQPTSSINTVPNTEDSTTSTLQYLPSKLHNSKILQCTASNGFGQSKTDSTALNVEFGVSSVKIENKNSSTFTDGGITSIKCLVGDSNPTATIKWSIANQDLPETSNILNYTARKTSNRETLRCTANNGIGENKSDFIILDIQYKPTVSLNPRSTSYYIIQGEKLYLECTVDSNPTVQTGRFTWRKNNQTVNGETSSVLIITESGRYTCTARNGIGEGTTNSIVVPVSYGPRVKVSTDSLNIKEGSTTELKCSSDSNPSPTTFQWYKPDGTRQSATQPLSISSRKQSGVYWCNATTTLISSNTSISNVTQTTGKQVTVTIYYFDPVKMSIVNQTVNENDKLNITCSTESNPRSSITWLNGSDVIETSDNTNKASLIRENADCFYTGNYSCKFVNPKVPGQEYTETTPIFITCSPRQDSRISSTTKISGNISDTIKLEVQVISYPKPTFQWYYIENNNSTLIINNSLFKEENIQVDTMIFRSLLEFKIQDATFYRDYKLQAWYGSNLFDIITTSILAQSAPNKVTGFKVTNITDNTVCVEWKPGFNGGAVQEFIVEYSTDNSTWVNSSPDTKLYDETSIKINYCITNLLPDTVYFIRLLSRNKFGSTHYIYIGNESEPLQTSASQNSYSTYADDRFGETVGIGIGTTLAVLIVAIIVVVYKYRKSREYMNNSEHYATFNRSAITNEQSYQELSVFTERNLNQNIQINNESNDTLESTMDRPYANVRQANTNSEHYAAFDRSSDINDQIYKELSVSTDRNLYQNSQVNNDKKTRSFANRQTVR